MKTPVVRNILLLVLTIAAVAITAFILVIPALTESKIIPYISEKTGVSIVSCNVRRVGFTGIDAANIRIGRENGGIFIPSVFVDYSPAGLFRKEIRKVVICGAELTCSYGENGFSVQGLEALISSDKTETAKKTPAPDSDLSISIQKIEIRNATLNLNLEKTDLKIPVNIMLIPGKGYKDVSAEISSDVQDALINATVNVHTDSNKGELRFNCDRISLGRIKSMFQTPTGISVSGESRLNGHVEFSLSPFKIINSDIACRVDAFNASYDGIRVTGPPPAGDSSRSLEIMLKSSSETGWNVFMPHAMVYGPVNTPINGLTTQITTTARNGITAKGGFSALISPVSIQGKQPVSFTPVPIACTYNADISNDRNWRFSLLTDKTGKKQAPVSINVKNANIHTALPELKVFGKGGDSGIFVDFGLSVPQIGCEVDDTQIKNAQVKLSGTLSSQNKEPASLAADIVFSGDEIVSTAKHFKIKNVSGKIPFCMPYTHRPSKGFVSADKIFITTDPQKEMDTGAVHLSLVQDKAGYAYKGDYTSRLLPGLNFKLTGHSSITDGDIRSTLDFGTVYATAGEINLKSFSESLNSIYAGGTVSIDGKIALSGNLMESSLAIHVKNGTVSRESIRAEGIDAGILITDLANLKSAPAQKLEFKKLTAGGLSVHGGKAYFQIESPSSIFIERGKLDWCGGTVTAAALRFDPVNPDYDFTLYCDRLNLAMLLEQLGVATAEGNGTVSGTVPFHVSGKKVTFKNGFLFSSPGDEGKIKLSGTDVLTAGIPKNTPQFAQIDLAREALKNYVYKWVKLRLTTEGENLSARLQFDGKPQDPLPFTYKKELGGFIRMDAKSKGSVFQGILLDVNFSMPIEKILSYKGAFDAIK